MTTTTDLFPVRLRVAIHTRAREIPWDDVLRPGRSLVYSWLHKVAPALADEVHGGRSMAPFGYGYPTFPNVAPEPGRYAAGGDGWWEFGTYRPDIAHAVARFLAAKPLVNWGGVAVTVTGVAAARPPDHSGGRATWSTQTPVCVRTSRRENNRCVLPREAGHLALLRASARRRATDTGIPIEGDPQVWVHSAGSRRSYLVSGSDTPRIGAPLTVSVVAPPRLLDVLWAVGIGQQTGAGFGWVHSPAGGA